MPHPTLPPLSTVLPPLILGTATFNTQYNPTPSLLPTTQIIHTALTSHITAFDTSPYYGPSEALLGAALRTSTAPRASYTLLTKVGRLAASSFDYSPSWIRTSVSRSLARLGTTYIDVVYCHDVEFASPSEVVLAVQTLRELRAEGKIRYVGISGYPLDTLVDLAVRVRGETGEPLDAVMSYAHYTLQNTRLAEEGVLGRLVGEAGVDVVLNGSPLGMGLLRGQGVPVGSQGDFHPAPGELRERCLEAARVCEGVGCTLEGVALRFSLEGWAVDGAAGGAVVRGRRMGVSVAGVSLMGELEKLLGVWGEVVKAVERRDVCERVQKVFAGEGGRKEWRNYSWPSPGEGYVRAKL